MSYLKFLIASKRNIRSSATRIYNDYANYMTYSSLKRENMKLKLTGIQVELKDVDVYIAEMKFLRLRTRHCLRRR